jgi:hypothetical protein
MTYEVHGDAQKMKDASIFFERPELTDALNRYDIRSCGSGFHECDGQAGLERNGLTGADHASSLLLHQYLTAAAQGFAAFESIILKCAELYENGKQASLADLSKVVDAPNAANLPDQAQIFLTPKQPKADH